MKTPLTLKSDMKQVPFRLDRSDYRVLRKLLADDGLSFQSFVGACVEAYTKPDPRMLEVLKTYRNMNLTAASLDETSRYAVSQRERLELLDIIEREKKAGS